MNRLLNAPLLILTLALTALSTPAQAAYASAELLPAALTRSVSLELGQAEFRQAQAALIRTQGDPLALRADLLAAQARLTQARVNQSAAQYALRLSLAQDLAALASTENDLRVARARAEIADVNFSAVQVRLKAGAANRLDLDKAQTDARNARASVTQLEAALAATRANVQGRAGKLPTQVLTVFPRPQLPALQSALASHPRQVEGNALIEAARQEVAVKSSDLSAPVEVQAARDALLSAQKTAEDTSRELRGELLEAWQVYQTALNTLASRTRSQAAAAGDAKVQDSRFTRGLISRLALLQSRADALQASASLDAARAASETALAQLSVAANAEVWK
jgi:outer membrane protein TolC